MNALHCTTLHYTTYVDEQMRRMLLEGSIESCGVGIIRVDVGGCDGMNRCGLQLPHQDIGRRDISP